MTGTVQHVHSVTVEGRDDGLYLFEQYLDACRFREAVIKVGGEAMLGEEPINTLDTTDELIEQELADVDDEASR